LKPFDPGDRSIALAQEWFDHSLDPAIDRMLKQPPKSLAPVALTFCWSLPHAFQISLKTLRRAA
jgi:hypothetical protein